MGLDLTCHDGQTPLDGDEREGLLLPTISTREELDELEQLNIEQALEYYLLRGKFSTDTIFTEAFVLSVHKRMFKDVWKWAGTFRKTNKNLGVDKFQVPIRLRQLLDNTRYWVEHSTYSSKEIAIRFKHELVSIHLFPNGNGRHSRLLADIIMKHVFGQPAFSWGSGDLIHPNQTRATYIQALRKADRGSFEELLFFAES